MKIWANDLKIGDSFYYISNLEIKHATIVDQDKGPLTRMSYWNLDNDEIFFVNHYVYDCEEDLIDEVIKEIQEDIDKSELNIQAYKILLDISKEKLHKYMSKKLSMQMKNNSEDSSIVWYNEEGKVNINNNDTKDSSLD